MPRQDVGLRGLQGFRAIGVCAVTCLLTIACGESTKSTGADSLPGGATADSSEPRSSCLGQPMVTLAIGQWRAELEAADKATATTLNALLSQAGMRAMPAEAGEVTVETIDARLGVGDVQDTILQVRSRYSDGSEALRVAVLRPVPGQDNAYCALGGELSHDKGPFEEDRKSVV